MLRRFARFTPIALLLVGVFAAGLLLSPFTHLPRLTEEEVQQTIVATITRETPASFLVTGTLDLTASVTMASEKTLLPGLLDLDLGTTTATVRAPGRAAYGFDARALRPENIRLEGDSVVVVTLPALQVLSVEPDLSRLDVQTRAGWARLESSSGRRMEQAALAQLNAAMRRQATMHLEGSSVQPRVNTAQAMEALLRPAFIALGHPDLRLRFQLAPDLVMHPEG